MAREVIIFFIGIFLLTQVLGLYIGSKYINLIKAMPELQPQLFPGVSPQSIENSIFLLFYILAITVVIILVIRFKKILLRGIEAVAIFFASLITFDFLFPIAIFSIPVSIFLSLGLTSWKMLRPSVLNQNLAVIFSVSGVGAFLGVSLGILPVLVFIILLSFYDFISVFVTKHMIYIAKEIAKTPTAFSAAFPYKFKKPVYFVVGSKRVKRHYQLGGGDIAIPLMFSVSVLREFTFYHTVFSMLGAVASLCLITYFVTKKHIALPALPWISSGMLIGFLISAITI
ncbi:MAG: presenilin family intramembrane aspartyl protease [Candidatus Aenigmarchaeota archaeon]|nr:presenilin family intramembrane aspartyl protease [Candidatus Aenigmarchaeota archaeon]